MISSPQSECFLNITQEFLVCTTIHKAKNLPAFNIDTFVSVSLQNKSKCTKVFQNSENPYYNELSCTLAQLLRLTILYEVKKRACCKTQPVLGELLIDLHTIWNQPNRSLFKKWGRLESPIGIAGEARGHLQIDLAIVSSHQPVAPAVTSAVNCDDIESNLLQSLDTSPSNIKYTICFYKGVFLKKTDYILQVSLAGMNEKTSIRRGTTNPEWNEEIQLNWTYPSVAQTFLLQVFAIEHLQWKCIAESEIHFDEISFDDVPSLGPTYIHFYDLNTYVGRILIEIKAKKLNGAKESIKRTIAMRSTQPLVEKSWWAIEAFVVEFIFWQGDFVHSYASNMKVVIKFGEFISDGVECFLKNYNAATTPVKYFTHTPPFKAVHIKCFLPDNRLKYENDHFMFMLVEHIKSEMESFKLFQLKYPENELIHCKCLKAIVLSIISKVQELQSSSRLQYNGFKQQTVWDENRLAYLKNFFDRLYKSLKQLRQDLKTTRDGESVCDKVFQELQQIRRQIESILQTRVQDEWPEMHLVMCMGKGSGKEFAICKLNGRHFVYSQRSECNGRWCSVPRNFIFKDSTCTHTCKNCGCVRGFVYGWMRIAAEAEHTEFASTTDWERKEGFYYQPKIGPSNFICRLYIHQAKIQPGADKSGLCDAKLKLIFGQEMVETSTAFSSLSPVWNESVLFALRKMPGPSLWYERNPPLLAVQAYDIDSLKASDYLGCGLVELSVQSAGNRKEPLKSFSDIGAAPDDFTSPYQERFRSKSAVLNFKQFLKTRVALQKLNELKRLSPPPLKWVAIASVGFARIEILMSGELLELNEDEFPDDQKAVIVKGIPKDIQPVMARFILEVTFIGLRNCQKLLSSTLGRYKIHLMMGEILLKSGLSSMRLKNSINFLESYTSGVVNLPVQLEYWPAIIATHIDCQGHGSEVTLGAALVSNPSKYLKQETAICDFDENEESTIVQVGEVDEESTPLLPPKSILKKNLFVRFRELISNLQPKRKKTKVDIKRKARIEELDYNWWTKFYNSMYVQQSDREEFSKHQLVIYPSELEKEADFSFLSDWAESIPLIHGVKTKKNMPVKDEAYATLKMHIELAPCQCNHSSSVTLNSVVTKISTKYQSASVLTQQTKVVVRVYLVQGIQFRSHDTHSQSDSYVKLQLGSHTISDRAHYIPNQSNPIFGKRFQMDALIPREHLLHISVFDRGSVCDELIGSTFIDLEDRLRTKHRATVGIANEFNRNGYNIWRDAMTPHEVLTDICKRYNLGTPLFKRNSVELDGVMFEDTTVISTEEDLQERLSLSVLKNIQDVPSFGLRLVPEHVETRSLYRSDRPGIEQGKLQLWIEIFDSDNVPPPIDITPTPARIYELRVIVYNCSDVVFNEKNIFGTKMSDIYIKAWCEDSEATQSTDIHYRSLTGEGNFNWRMIFPIKYSIIEDMMVIKQMGGLLEQYETKQPPTVYLQIWENDALSSDDFMGSLEICLSNFPQPFENKTACTDKQVNNKNRTSVNLFRQKTIRGWFPCKGVSERGNVSAIAGKLELELEILPESEAAANPAGLGRNPPNALSAPERPKTSFNAFTSPLKSLKHILLPVVKKCLCYCVLIAFLVILLMLLIEDLPHQIMGLLSNF